MANLDEDGGQLFTHQGSGWGLDEWSSLFKDGIGTYLSYEQQKSAQELEGKKIAASNPLYVRNADGTMVRAGTVGAGGASPLSPVVLFGGAAVLGLIVLLLLKR